MESPVDPKDGEKGPQQRYSWRNFFGHKAGSPDLQPEQLDDDRGDRPSKWGMGVLNDKLTHEVPGSVLLLANLRNEPLGLRNAPARTSRSSLPLPYPPPSPVRRLGPHSDTAFKKKTSDGLIVLEPQPEDSDNDPLNWPAWRRDSALLSLGLYCMIGGGMTSVLAAGFTDVAATYNVSVPKVALTTGLYMSGLGMGSVFASPTAILYGKRPVYLAGCVLFVATSIWCALSPNYPSLVAARVLQGVSVSPVECLPSATIAEIFFLHERAYRIGIYTLLLLGGKNLVPLVSAAIIESLEWRWVFWIVAMVVTFCGVLVFFFVPETFWDRTPRPKSSQTLSRLPSVADMYHRVTTPNKKKTDGDGPSSRVATANAIDPPGVSQSRPVSTRKKTPLHVDFSVDEEASTSKPARGIEQFRPPSSRRSDRHTPFTPMKSINQTGELDAPASAPYLQHLRGESQGQLRPPSSRRTDSYNLTPTKSINETGELETPASTEQPQTPRSELQGQELAVTDLPNKSAVINRERPSTITRGSSLGRVPILDADIPDAPSNLEAAVEKSSWPKSKATGKYTTTLRGAPKRSFIQQLRPFEGRLHHDNWFRVALRPFILFAYPAVLWSSAVYACSVGWLIVLSETVAVVYRDPDTYNFSALSTGLVYLSPFIGGILGTAVAGKVSDVVVRAFARRNGGLYEPEFRLIMAIPVALATAIGLMGFGWSAENHDSWIVPTIFFGTMSFGCTLGSTTAITFCVDSYRQYAGEALVTLNFSKNIFHGLVFSLFVDKWIDAKGVKSVFLALGGIQLALLATTVPMYIWGKRARMWTVRMNLMERF